MTVPSRDPQSLAVYVVRTCGDGRAQHLQPPAPPYYPSCNLCRAKMLPASEGVSCTTAAKAAPDTDRAARMGGARQFACSRCGARCAENALDFRFKLELLIVVDAAASVSEASTTIKSSSKQSIKKRLMRMTVFGDCVGPVFGVSANELKSALNTDAPVCDEESVQLDARLLELSTALDVVLTGMPIAVSVNQSLVCRNLGSSMPVLRLDAAPRGGIVSSKMSPLFPITTTVADLIPWLASAHPRPHAMRKYTSPCNQVVPKSEQLPPSSPQLTADWDIDPDLVAEMLSDCPATQVSLITDSVQAGFSDSIDSQFGGATIFSTPFSLSSALLGFNLPIRDDDGLEFEVWSADDDAFSNQAPQAYTDDSIDSPLDHQQLLLALSQSSAFRDPVGDDGTDADEADEIDEVHLAEDTAGIEALMAGLTVDDFVDDLDDAWSELDDIDDMINLVERIELDHHGTKTVNQ